MPASLKWTALPPGVRRDSSAAASFPRTGRDRSAFHRRAPGSSRRTRGWRPQVIEVLRHAVRSEPKLEPCETLERVLRRAVGSEPKLEPSETLERGARLPPVSRGSWTGAGLSKDPVPRRGFPHPLRSASAVFHDLGGLLLSAPSDVFQSVTLMEFDSENVVPEGGPSSVSDPKTGSSRDPLRSCRVSPGREPPKRSGVRPVPGEPGSVNHGVPGGFDPSYRPGPLAPSAVASDSTGAALPELDGVGSADRGPPGVTPTTRQRCRPIPTEAGTHPRARKIRPAPGRSVTSPEGDDPGWSTACVPSRSPGMKTARGRSSNRPVEIRRSVEAAPRPSCPLLGLGRR
jgi:hypothetical protein